jgi:signal transduction histidine kinase
MVAEMHAPDRLRQLQLLTDAALAHLELDALLSTLLLRTREILGVDTCAVLLLDEHTNELVARAAVGIEEEVEAGVRIPLGRGFAGRVAAERRPLILDDVDTADVFNPILREKGIKSMLGVPLLVHGRAIGVLHVGTLHHRHFDADDTELLQLVSERVAIAVERAQLHQETVRLDQVKLNFVAIASHELRTPATSVYGAFATLVQRGGELDPDVREQLTRIGHEQSLRLCRLIEELLDLSRLDARAITVDPRPVGVQAVLARVVEGAVPGETSLRLEVAPDLTAVADPLVIDRVVSNLLTNAARYGAPPIVVSAEVRERHLRIAVEDHGEGVMEALRPRLFDRFARGGETSGSGLGLAIARAYARAHGGDLVYDPTTRGARFELILPRG